MQNPVTGASLLAGGPVSLTNFQSGVWVLFSFIGNVKLHIVNVSGPNAVISALAFDTQCAMPTFTPAAGSYNSTQRVTIGTLTSGATMRYTTDGTTPGETTGTIYSTPLNISDTTRLQAIAYANGLSDSYLADGVYAFGTPAKIEWTAAGTWSSPQTQPANLTVGNLLCDGAAISSTANQGTAENGWMTGHNFTFTLAVPANQAITITGWSLTDWNNWTNIKPQCTLTVSGGLAAPLGAGNFTQGTANGNGDFSIAVNPPLVVLPTGSYTLTLHAMDPNCGGDGGWCGWNDYAINLVEGGACAAPAFNPAAGTYNAAQTVTISSTTSDATIRYTTDGSTPTETSGTVYSTPLNITRNTTLQAIAYMNGMADSPLASAVYTIQIP